MEPVQAGHWDRGNAREQIILANASIDMPSKYIPSKKPSANKKAPLFKLLVL